MNEGSNFMHTSATPQTFKTLLMEMDGKFPNRKMLRDEDLRQTDN
jgi:aspartyl-tRNA synthetase